MNGKYHWLNHILNFIAVILGVYLAFYLNERAEIRLENKESEVLLNSVLNDLSADIKVYNDYQIPVNKAQLQDTEILINMLWKDSLDGVSDQISKVMQLDNYAPAASTYNSMKSSGKLSLIKDLKLQKMLTGFYDGLVSETIRKSEYQVDFFSEHLVTWLIEDYDMLEDKILDEDALVGLRNKLMFYQMIIDQKVGSYEMIVEEASELIAHIESLQKDQPEDKD
jgi:hypothetical protein